MPVPEINICPSLFTEGYHTYSPAALGKLFDGKKVSHILPYDAPWTNEDEINDFTENRKHISISGVQEKYSLIQVKNKLRLTGPGEQGTHILKPHPVTLKRPRELPANEHLTMQIASQVFKINTAPCGIIFFQNGDAAYITKRFDVLKDGSKLAKEDFATLSGKTGIKSGPDFKYEGSYQRAGSLIKKFVPASAIETEKFFSIVLFNYLFSNGDAHLKNFALLETPDGDHMLSPAYDLVNTGLHIDDSDFALKDGLLEGAFRSASYKKFGHAGKDDFLELANRLGMNSKRIHRILDLFTCPQPLVETLISRSFLETKTKQYYLACYKRRLKELNAG